MDEDQWFKKRTELESNVVKSVDDLMKHIGTNKGFFWPIENTSPQIYLTLGKLSDIIRISLDFQERFKTKI